MIQVEGEMGPSAGLERGADMKDVETQSQEDSGINWM